MKRIPFILISAIFILTACASVAATNTPADNGGDAITPPDGSQLPNSTVNPNLKRGGVYLDSAELLTLESYPLQFTLALKGNLPTPCNHLKVDVNLPDAQNKIVVDVYSLVDPKTMCTQALQPFEENVPLGSFPSGHYTLWLNGKQIAEFDA